MAYCPKCGAQIGDDVQFCPSCGTQAATGAANPNFQQPAGGAYAATPEQDAANNKAMGILAYLGILVLVPIFAAKDSPFARFHANQGLVLAISQVAYWVAYAILSFILAFIPVIGWILILILSFEWIFWIVLAIMGIVNAAGGHMKPLPLIGKITILK